MKLSSHDEGVLSIPIPELFIPRNNLITQVIMHMGNDIDKTNSEMS